MFPFMDIIGKTKAARRRHDEEQRMLREQMSAALVELTAERRELIAQMQPFLQPGKDEARCESEIQTAEQEVWQARRALDDAQERRNDAYNALSEARKARYTERDTIRRRLAEMAPRALHEALRLLRDARGHGELRDRLAREIEAGDCSEADGLLAEVYASLPERSLAQLRRRLQSAGIAS